ncbi:MAG: glutaminyl-peptide cyclotransferase [Bacteroidetes bacterium]|nr:glutaminyl-peptide cyclotransferase [Bacteroidota bacterium]
MKKLTIVISLLAVLLACNNDDSGSGGTEITPDSNVPRTMSYSVVATYPHDTSSFTEGLLFYNGEMYEGTGNYGKSRLMKTDLTTGKVLKSINLDKPYFGEGIVIVRDTVYQLTYKEEVGFKYTLKDFKKIGEFKFASKEGWGMTFDGQYIIASDGSKYLYYYDPSTFSLVKKLEVLEGNSYEYSINELEFINGFIYANKWQTSYILKIDPANGRVVAKADLTDLYERLLAKAPYIDTGLNGIAYNAATKKIYITGKNWPELYEVQFGE